jgi:ATP-dependent exoDNAse (exonuclease V) beta subunit
MKEIIDQKQRSRALDPQTSFIVQAPAGSGKTGLLIQRYLGLLCRVKYPEEILAITFTRKAAAEMRNRVLKALEEAGLKKIPENDYQAVTLDLARRAASRDKARGWGLIHDPGRMRIMTIDSLCAGLARQMPVLSGFGAPGRISEDPGELYAMAARNTVAELEEKNHFSEAIENLLGHLDNRVSSVESLVAMMLPRREQWLRHVAGIKDPEALRAVLEASMGRVVTETLEKLRASFPLSCIADTSELCRFAGQNLEISDPDNIICLAKDLGGLPGTNARDLGPWQAVAELFLTKSGQWRKKVTKSIGFPAPSSVRDSTQKAFFEEKKISFKNLAEIFEADPELCANLDAVRRLPAPAYTQEQWALLKSLFSVLKLAAGYLENVFRQTGQVDFAEIAIRARDALGKLDDPSDLALCLDYKISHILVDEFQDTSISQFDLLRQLTAGWSPEDGRTFFAVGDPMQSIYGFREAEVGLFLNAWQRGIDDHIFLEPLLLKTNFRSGPGIVKWVNSVFSRVLPERADPDTGAVPYMQAHAAGQSPEPAPAVEIHAIVFAGEEKQARDRQEALEVVRCAKEALKSDCGQTVGILVRSRSHLLSIVPCLQDAGLRFSAVEIDTLADRPVIRDLVSLTRAISHPADRIAWLAVLRAPWCGLTLKDLHVIAGDDHQSPVVSLIHDKKRVDAMSPDGRVRLLKLRSVMDAALDRRGRQSLRRQVEGAWIALGGPAAVLNSGHLADVPVYLDYIDKKAGAGLISDINAFEQGVSKLFAQPDSGADTGLQIMTVHKAKGLEFDTVILPGLHKAPRGQDPSLLLWQERAGTGKDKSLLMAPISGTGSQGDLTYNYIRQLHQDRLDYETGRLLYVAATRASKRLHIFAAVKISEDGIERPHPRSLLAVLWPVVSQEFEKAAGIKCPDTKTADSGGQPLAEQVFIHRLAADWELPAPPADISVKTSEEKDSEHAFEKEDLLRPGFDWAGLTVRRVGSVVHRWLRQICEQGLENWSQKRVEDFSAFIKRDLVSAGVPESESDKAVLLATRALSNAVAHDTGRWILSAHSEGACEYGISGFINNELVHAIIDRTFVDEHNMRWVIDYKSSTHFGGGLEQFLDREQSRYSPQMTRYARLMHQLDGRQVRMGLYFPMMGAWRQWDG